MSNLMLAQARRTHRSLFSIVASISNVVLQTDARNLAQRGAALSRSVVQQQQYTSAPTDSQQGTPLKTALRQLYKRVHPDLFTDYPAEQAENERSFKLLQDYLHQARNPSTGPAARTAYHFSFYLLPQHSPDSSETIESSSSSSSPSPSPSAAVSPSFHHVQLSLAPPEAPRSSSSGSQPLSLSAGKGLRRLLQRCGFSDVVVDEGQQQDTHSKLTTFIPEAAEYVRQHESGAARHEVRVANIRAAIRLAWRVVAGFQANMFSGDQQVEQLQKLTQALNLLAEDDDDADITDLSGLQIMITDQTALNGQGVLCLAASDSAEDWADFLGGVDVDFARDKKSSAAAVRHFESQVAAAVGVRMVFTAATYLMTPEYRRFLERLTAYAADHGPVQPVTSTTSSSSTTTTTPTTTSTHSGIPVYVAPPYQYQSTGDQHHHHHDHDHHHHQQQQQPEWVVHETMGYIMVKMSDTAQQVYDTVKAHGQAAARILARKHQHQQEMAELSASVRSRLGIRHLYKDELVSREEFKSACKRLLYHRDMLLRCNIEGLSVKISDRNKVAADGSVVDIAWNFDM